MACAQIHPLTLQFYEPRIEGEFAFEFNQGWIALDKAALYFNTGAMVAICVKALTLRLPGMAV